MIFCMYRRFLRQKLGKPFFSGANPARQQRGVDTVQYISIELLDPNIHCVNTVWWKQLMALFMREGVPFEIRCWREETAAIKQALALGTLSEVQSTDYEVSVTGILTRSTIHQILRIPKPADANQMTPFFTINLDGLVQCGHYGTELYLIHPTDAVLQKLRAIFAPIQSYFVFGTFDS